MLIDLSFNNSERYGYAFILECGSILSNVKKDIVSLRKGKLRKWGEGDRYSLVIAGDCAITIQVPMQRREERMTMFSSIRGPGEASEGKPKVAFKRSFRAGRHVVSKPERKTWLQGKWL